MTVPLHADPLINPAFRPEEIGALDPLTLDIRPSENYPAPSYLPVIYNDKTTGGVDLVVVVHDDRRPSLDLDCRHLVLNDGQTLPRKCIQRTRVDHSINGY